MHVTMDALIYSDIVNIHVGIKIFHKLILPSLEPQAIILFTSALEDELKSKAAMLYVW